MIEIKRWKQAAREALAPGLIVAAATTLAVAACGKLENDDAVTPLNDISHILWGDAAFEARSVSVRHTLAGLFLNAAASISWATLFARFFGAASNAAPQDIEGRDNSDQAVENDRDTESDKASQSADERESASKLPRDLAWRSARHSRRFAFSRHLCGGILVSGVAYVIDYHVVPSRLKPGFERHLSPRALLWIYITLAISLATGSLNRD